MQTKVYALQLKDRNELYNSSSGGAFTAISDVFLQNGDAILCSSYNYTSRQMEFNLFFDKASRDMARGSKYFQSKPGDSFREAISWLKNNKNKKLLFVGMGCQAEGFRLLSELSGVRDRVLIVDIICTGVPSPKLWKEYSDIKGKVDYLTFKDKRNGWNYPTPYVVSKGKEKSITEFVSIFYSHNALRFSCYECPFAKVVRNTDITIGDYWHIEKTMPDFYDAQGNSLLLVHTDTGKEYVERLKEVNIQESTVENCMQNMLRRPTPRPETREEFWKEYRNGDIKKVVRIYGGQVSMIRRLKRKIKCIIRGGVH